MWAIACILFSYLLGSVIFSLIIGKMVKGVDVRKHGSGNAGATNTLRVIGIGPAILVFVLDISKGALAVLLARWVQPDLVWLQVASGLAAIAGHNWPVWFRFRGGKGIATTIGMVVGLAFLPGLIAGLIAILAIVLTRYVSLGSLIFTALFPVFVLIMSYPTEIILGSFAIMAFAWLRHRTNIVKLMKGQENKLGAKSQVKNV
jgi:glycerol-3-phosphate acyltransferase PlsY